MIRRFAQVPMDIWSDLRISGDALRAYGFMLDASRDGISMISLRRIGERIGHKRDTARRCVRQLIEAGHVIELPIRNGQCPKYRLSTISKPATGTGSENATGQEEPPVAKMPPDPSQECNGTRSKFATHPIRTSLYVNSNNDVRTENGNEKDERRAIVSAKLLALGATKKQAQELSQAELIDTAELWANVGLDGVPKTGINKPVAYIIASIRDGIRPTPRKSSLSDIPIYNPNDPRWER